MSGSDSSEEENAAQLREAADNQFLKDSMFKRNHRKGHETAAVTRIPSRRPDRKDVDPKMLQVTTEFQNHVAKHLMRIIDSQIEEIPACDGETGCTKAGGDEGGVRLLGNSNVLLSVDENLPEKKITPRPTKRELPDDVSEKERLSEAAVSAEWILSQEATKGWAKNTKGEVIVVKNSEGKKSKKTENDETGTNSEGQDADEEAKRRKKSEKRKRRKERLKLQQAAENGTTVC